MAFVNSILTYMIILVISVCVAGAGILLGKKLRDRKDSKVKKI